MPNVGIRKYLHERIVMTESIIDWVQVSSAPGPRSGCRCSPAISVASHPWGAAASACCRPELFSLTAHHSQPLLDAPITEPTGGTLYLDGEPNAEDLAATLRLLGVPAAATDYAAFVSHVQKPAEERYLTQVRIVRRVALAALYDVLSEADLRSFPRQKLTVGGLIAKFIETEQQRWGTSLSTQLSKCFTNPGQRFCATLAFGFMIENAFYGVYRIWSRAWLVPQ